jgi:cellobiose transport system substrate-binding protein
MHISRWIAALAAITAVAGTLGGCSGPGAASPPGSADQGAQGPAVTLRVALYGSPGYRQAGLFSTYERLHPGVRIVPDTTGSEAGYWRALRQHLATGRGLDDLVAIPLARISNAVHKYRSSLVPLSTLGGVGGGVNTFEYQWPRWLWKPAYHAGQAYAIGAETGPLALCYRPQLLAEAGLPSSPARMPVTSTPDPTATSLAPLVAAALAHVQSGALTPARAWSRLLRQSTRS